MAGAKPAGKLSIDAGATRAICQGGRSLLPSGIRHVEGDFGRGEIVSIVDEAGRERARGLASYTSAEMRKIVGSKSEQISERLGYIYREEAVHRNDMILIG